MRIILAVFSLLVLTGCGPLAMDSFEDWEPAVGDYLQALGERQEFADEAHAVAYALSVDCFETTEPRSELDNEVATACVTGFGLLSDIMTLEDVCTWVRFDGNQDVERINGQNICG